MAATKSGTVLQTSASNAAGATKNSTAIDLSTAYGAVITALITNGGTGPTLPCAATLQISPDGSTWKTWAQGTAGLTASAAYSFAWEVPPPVMQARVSFSGNTGQAVTVEAQAQALTSL